MRYMYPLKNAKNMYLVLALSGFAALSWEVIWQIKISLALGVSAWGTAITLAVMMGGMSLGALLFSKILKTYPMVQAVRLYAWLEFLAGTTGFLLVNGFASLEKIDSVVYASVASLSSFIFILGVITLIGIPTLFLGATFPLFRLIAKQFQFSLAKLYSYNTMGAALGALCIAFILIPILGVTHAIWFTAAINILIGIFTWFFIPNKFIATCEDIQITSLQENKLKTIIIVFVTGFATFVIEVAWFRSFASIFPNTTDVFAIMIACVLLALSFAANKIPSLKQKKKLLGTQICIAGILILFITPLLERLDKLTAYAKLTPDYNGEFNALNWLLINPDNFMTNWIVIVIYLLQILVKFFVIYFILVPPMKYLSTAFPWLVDNEHSQHSVGLLYSVNTVAAILGSIITGWFLLANIGFAKSSWLAGILVILAGLLIIPGRKRVYVTAISLMALSFAVLFETGIGKTRVQGFHATDELGNPGKLLEFYEGPDVTTSAVEYQDGTRALLINSSLAAWESGRKYRPSTHYMAWMGHLPMLMHTDPKKTLVICFGTGQTANAVRKENPNEIDIVDINPNVFKLAHHFKSNEAVLNDPRVKTIVMDGRAYLRRTKKVYDVITLEPMPPIAAQVNALYSKEFYDLADKKLAANGVIAQWLPFHIASPHYNASIAKTFMQVFPNAILWIDHDAKTGILIGSKNKNQDLTTNWPGLERAIKRNLSANEVKQSLALTATQLQQYSKFGEMINDDNQLLAYGKALYATGLFELNFALLHHINNKIEIPRLTDFR